MSVILLFFIYALFTAGYFALCCFYGGYAATLDTGLMWLHLVLLCIACLLLWLLVVTIGCKYIQRQSVKSNLFRKKDKYGLTATSAFGIGLLAVLSVGAALYFLFALLPPENVAVRRTEGALVLSYLILNYILYISAWSRCQTYHWCPKCGRFWGKTYYVADEIGRETHEYKYRERERASTVENADGNLVASIYNDVEKTGYTVRYYYRLRHRCKHCGDWEEQITIDKPTMFDGAWIEPLDTADVVENINVTLTSPEEKRAPQSVPAPQPAQPLPGAQDEKRLQPGRERDAYLEDLALKQLQNKNP